MSMILRYTIALLTGSEEQIVEEGKTDTDVMDFSDIEKYETDYDGKVSLLQKKWTEGEDTYVERIYRGNY